MWLLKISYTFISGLLSSHNQCSMTPLLFFFTVVVGGLVAASCLTFLWPHGLQPARLLVHGILQARTLEWVAMPSFRASSWPRDQIPVCCIAGGSPASQADSLLLSHQGGPKWEHLTVFVHLLKITTVNPLHININSTFTESSYIFLLRNNLVRRETLLYLSETLTSGSRGNS